MALVDRDPLRREVTIAWEELAVCIRQLRAACEENPQSAPLWTSLGMVQAMNEDHTGSIDSLETARALDGRNFWAQHKYAEMHYRLGELPKAEQEARAALDLADTPDQFSVARRQLSKISEVIQERTHKPEWTGSYASAILTYTAAMSALFWLAEQL